MAERKPSSRRSAPARSRKTTPSDVAPDYGRAGAQSAADVRDARRIALEGSSFRPSATQVTGTHPGLLAAARAASGDRVVIVHNAVGPFVKGTTVPAAVFAHPDAGGPENLAYLLELGAIEEESAPVEEKSSRHRRLVESVAAAPTLEEALRSDSPPTLPNAPDLDEDPETLREMAAAPSQFPGPLPETVEERDERVAEQASEHAD